MKTYKITYEQVFRDEVLTSSYNRKVSNRQELMNAVNTLREDPHVVAVTWEEIEDN